MRKISTVTQRRKLAIGWRRFLSKRKRNKRRVNRKGNAWRAIMPNLSDIINWIAKRPEAFTYTLTDNNHYQHSLTLKVPKNFSIIDEERESLYFIRNLFDVLFYQKCYILYIDYVECEEIELGASVCMDIILKDFIKFYSQCRKRKFVIRVSGIKAINYKKNLHIAKFLCSSGAFKNVSNLDLKFPDIITYPLCMGCKNKPGSHEKTEVDITELVDYLKECLGRMDRELTPQEDKIFLDVIGEVMANAEEHSTTRHRYSIGYFQEIGENKEHIGVFNLVILNFGATIYEKFQSADPNVIPAVNQMKDLSDKYTRKGFIRPSHFQEETLWTLYALQEGVTSLEKHRGGGTIKFIEGFFDLKGDDPIGDGSQLTLISGNTRIIFDGTYRLLKKKRGQEQREYKMFTFNDSGNIEDKPDSKYVKHVNNYFPGTLITAKIYIKHHNR